MPMLLVLSTEGLLCPFYVINFALPESIAVLAEPLPAGGERIGSGKFGFHKIT